MISEALTPMVSATDNGNGNEKADNARVADVMTVAAAIVEHCDGEPGVGRIPCPICKTGIVGYSIAKGRSVAARCSTPGCVAFMG